MPMTVHALTTKLLVWTCIAHCWILTCSIIYVRIEGLSTKNRTDAAPLSQTDLVIETLSNLNLSKLSELKRNKANRKEFARAYEKRLKWNAEQERRVQFRDISKVYVFVLLSHTGIGSHANMRLQTWQAQLFYAFAMPFGLLFYYTMIHQIVSELFEVDAYATVTVYQRMQLAWTVDQRELYEKLKVFIFALLRLLAAIYLLALLGLLSAGKSYAEGLYLMINMAFLVSSCHSNLFPYREVSHELVAFLMTVLVFAVVLMFYAVLYSLFIMFRYHTLVELYEMVCTNSDEMNDAATIDFDEVEDRDENVEQRSNIRASTQPENNEFWWENEENVTHNFPVGSPIPIQARMKVKKIQPGSSQAYEPIYTSSESDEEEEEEEFENEVEAYNKHTRETKAREFVNRMKIKPQSKPVLKLNTSRVQPPFAYTPSIAITTATPSPVKEEQHDYFEHAHSAY